MNENKYFLVPLIADYLDFLKNIKGLSENTTSSYKRDLNKFSKFSEASGVNDFKMLKEEIKRKQKVNKPADISFHIKLN